MNTRMIIALSVLCVATVMLPQIAASHCDTMEGPVVKAAQKALATGDVAYVLIWVQKRDEAEVRDVFQKTLVVRKLNTQARDFADRHFFETVVRLHRAGEGAPYTGLKPPGHEIEPMVVAADKALEEKSAEQLFGALTKTIQEGLFDQFNHVIAHANYDRNDVEVGRAYVKAYVEFIHYVERLYNVARTPAKGHFDEPETAGLRGEQHAE